MRVLRYIPAMVVFYVVLSSAPPAIPIPGPQEDSPSRDDREKTPKEKSRLERLVEELSQELGPYAEDGSLDSLNIENAGAYDFDLVVLGDDNPLISDECYKLVLQHAAEEMKRTHPELSRAEALRMGLMHVHENRQAGQEHGRTYGEFFTHVVQCDEWCQPMVVGLEKCHIAAVAGLDPWPVFFDYDSDNAQLGSDITFARVIEKLESTEDGNVLLVARASRLGNKIYNRTLSYRRALAVRDELVGLGVESDRIRLLWFGWEPPQIGEQVAEAYGIGDVYHVDGEYAVNQSVMVVVY